MKKLPLLLKSLALAVCATAALSANAANYVVVSSEGTDDVEFAIGDSPKVTFTTSDLVITSGETSVSYPMTKTVTFRFSDTSMAGISDASAATVSFRLDGDILFASGLDADDIVEVYDLRGSRVACAPAVNGEAQIDLSSTVGIIIVKTNGTTFKLAK